MKTIGKITVTLAVLYGLVNGIGTLVPSKYDSFGEEYNRPCAAFRTNKVRKIALEQQSELIEKLTERRRK